MTPVEQKLHDARRRHDHEINVAAFAPRPPMDRRTCRECGSALTMAEVIEKHCIRCAEIVAEVRRELL
ncbi:hypothetical protein FS799_00885 [Agrobacterium vitis]|uniref:hypothetical protein n=1 Tax=Agrobacterium vitis TaxID=373 RepID=UPI001F227BCD|nr:hypothetical protein [Agrobacterium vitis]MCE6073411.1 hypothetical protein [Agrobacterium vitis]